MSRRQRFGALALLLLAALACGGARAAEAPEWEVYRSNVKATQCAGVKGGTVGDILGSFLDYEFDLPLEFMRRAQAYTGPNAKLRRVMAQMLSGQKVEVAVLGGSISAGAVASRKMDPDDPNDVWNLVRLELQSGVSPKIEFHNNARAATKSYITSLCIDRFLNATADLVFVEFIANDGSEMDTQLQGPLEKTRSYERFLRKIMRQPSNPAVVMMQMLVSEMAIPAEGREGKPKRGFWSTPEDGYSNLAQYYDIPAVSFRDALWQLGDNRRDGMGWSDFMAEDRLHPNDRGHRLMADMVIYLLQQTAVDLLMHPITGDEVGRASAALPPPMFDGNEGASSQVCAQGKSLSKFIVASAGWELVAFDKGGKFPTFGYETTAAGEPLILEVDTTGTGDAKRGRGVAVTYTKAQSGFGKFKISCTNGCACDPVAIDATLPYDQTVVFLEEVRPTPAPQCHVVIELDGASPAGSKVRISGVAVSADPGTVSGRIGEEKYMSWLSGDNWSA